MATGSATAPAAKRKRFPSAKNIKMLRRNPLRYPVFRFFFSAFTCIWGSTDLRAGIRYAGKHSSFYTAGLRHLTCRNDLTVWALAKGVRRRRRRVRATWSSDFSFS